MPRLRRLIEGLQCPRDFEDLMEIDIEARGRDVTVDICPKCSGMFLDDGELQRLLGDRKLADYLTREIGTKTESPIVCPACGGLMDLQYAEDTEVDVCLECKGVWLDAGELDDLRISSLMGFEGDKEMKDQEIMEEIQARYKKRAHGRLGRIFGR